MYTDVWTSYSLMSSTPEPPLSGLRILAVEQYGAGPYGTLHLASLGAQVIKIETPGEGDVSRGVGPHFLPAEDDSSKSLFYQGLNHNKRSIGLDLDCPEGKEVLLRLAAASDGLINNLRGDVPARLGLEYANFRKVNKQLVCVHLSGYGRCGPRAHWPGYDYVMQARAGYFALTGEPSGPPARFGLSIVDLQAGVTMAMALLAGIVGARASGRGRDLDVSLYDVAMHNLNYVAMWSLNADYHQRRIPRSAHFSLTPCQLYRTADSWIYLMCNKEKFWRALCGIVGREDLQSDPRFASAAARLDNREELTRHLDGILATDKTAAWLERFAGRVPAAPVLDVQGALNDDFLRRTGRILEYQTGSGNRVRALRPPVHAQGQPPLAAAPVMGGDTNAILGRLGYSKAEILNLRQRRIVQ